jgi:hypothetical protein
MHDIFAAGAPQGRAETTVYPQAKYSHLSKVEGDREDQLF